MPYYRCAGQEALEADVAPVVAEPEPADGMQQGGNRDSCGFGGVRGQRCKAEKFVSRDSSRRAQTAKHGHEWAIGWQGRRRLRRDTAIVCSGCSLDGVGTCF